MQSGLKPYPIRESHKNQTIIKKRHEKIISYRLPLYVRPDAPAGTGKADRCRARRLVFNFRRFHPKGICHLVHHCGSKSNRCQQGGANLVVAGYQGRWLQDGQHQFLFRFHHLNTGYRDEDYSDRSFINRTTLLGNPDIILICGGTNDSWANAPIGNYQYSNWKRADLYCFRPALAKLLSDLRQRHPNVDIYFILNSELKDEINESVKKICKTYQVPVIALHDIDKKNGHPTIKGMRSLADQVLKVIKK